jgi:hypothetical protein
LRPSEQSAFVVQVSGIGRELCPHVFVFGPGGPRARSAGQMICCGRCFFGARDALASTIRTPPSPGGGSRISPVPSDAFPPHAARTTAANSVTFLTQRG